MNENCLYLEDLDYILNEAIITNSSLVDTQASYKAINKVKKDFAKKISSGKYRNYKSSDKQLLESTIKNDIFKKKMAAEIAGTTVGAAFGAVAGSYVEKGIKSTSSKNEDVDYFNIVNESIEFYMENLIDYLLSEDVEILDEADIRNKLNNFAKNKIKKKSFKQMSNSEKSSHYRDKSREYSNKAKEKLNSAKERMSKHFSDSNEQKINNEKIKQLKAEAEKYTSKAREMADLAKTATYVHGSDAINKINSNEKISNARNKINSNSKVQSFKNKADLARTGVYTHASDNKAGTAVGAGVGALSGAMLAKKLMSAMQYKVFLLGSLTILSIYPTNKEGQAKNKSVCYALLVKSDGSKLLMQKIALKGKNN